MKPLRNNQIHFSLGPKMLCPDRAVCSTEQMIWRMPLQKVDPAEESPMVAATLTQTDIQLDNENGIGPSRMNVIMRWR